MSAVWTLCVRELVRFYRDKGRVIGAVVPPLVFWVLIGAGLGDSFRHAGSAAGADYLQYFFPGTVLLVVLFTAVFATISVIEDRREGFLQSVLVAPVSRWEIVLGKILGASAIGFIQGLLMLVLAPVVGLGLTPSSLATVLLTLALAALGLTGLGFLIAWRLDSTQGFHSVMNLFLIPMWMLSGALFPAEGAPAWMRAAVALNPLSYAVWGMQRSFTVSGRAMSPSGGGPALCLGVLVLFAAVTFSLSVREASRRSAPKA